MRSEDKIRGVKILNEKQEWIKREQGDQSVI